MNIVFVGAGRVATSLSLALAKAGHHILQVYSRTETSAKALADRLGADYTTDIDKLVLGSHPGSHRVGRTVCLSIPPAA